MAIASNVISFRAPDTVIDAIDLAREPTKLSRGDWVRAIVEAQLVLSDQQALLTHLENVRGVVESLRKTTNNLETKLIQVRGDVARSTALILSHDTMTTDDADQLVRQILGGEGRT